MDPRFVDEVRVAEDIGPARWLHLAEVLVPLAQAAAPLWTCVDALLRDPRSETVPADPGDRADFFSDDRNPYG